MEKFAFCSIGQKNCLRAEILFCPDFGDFQGGISRLKKLCPHVGIYVVDAGASPRSGRACTFQFSSGESWTQWHHNGKLTLWWFKELDSRKPCRCIYRDAMGRPLPFLCVSPTTFGGLQDAGHGVTHNFETSEFQITKFDSGFHCHFPLCFGGLVDLPSAWWTAAQRMIFFDHEVSCQSRTLTCDTSAKTQLAMRHNLSSCVCVIYPRYSYQRSVRKSYLRTSTWKGMLTT